MTDIQDRVGAKWFAGLVLAVLLMNMGNGLVLTAYAEEDSSTASSTEAAPEETSAPEPEEESAPLSEESETSTEENAGPGEDGEDGAPLDEEPTQEEAGPGEDGAEGADGNATSTSDGVETDITTGDAEAGAEAGGIVNITDVDTNASSTNATSTPPASSSNPTPPAATSTATSTDPAQTASSTPVVDTSAASSTSDTSSAPEPTSTPENGGSGGGNLDITHNLTASTTLEAEGNTGENTISDPDGGTQDTGDGNVWGQDNFFFNIALVDSSLQIEVLLNPTESELDFRNQLIDFFSFSAEADEDAEECVKFYNCKKSDELNATSTNSALLERNMAVLCNSGANYGGVIGTGDCNTSGVMTTMGNWFAFNSNLMVLLVNQVGDMNADVVLPEPSFFENMRKGTIAQGSNLDINNNASTTVNGASLANTGESSGEEGVVTGEAEADAATINLINQLNPLTCFIVAVGGTWNGEIYQLPQGFMSEETPFGEVVCGRGSGVGDVKAINAVVKNDLEMVVNALTLSNTGGNAGTFVTTGNAKSFLTILNMVNTVFINQDWMLGLFTVSGDWNGDLTFGARPDASPQEQAASDIVSGKKSKNKKAYADSKVELTKTSAVTTATFPTTVEYTVTLKNNGKKIYRAVLEDTLTNPVGSVVNTQTWDLGTVLAGEEITVEYVVEFNGSLLPGNYLNSVKLTGRHGDYYGTHIRPVSASATLELLEGEVLGVGDCPAYLTGYVVPGATNNPEQVRLLEEFLREGRGEPIEPDGTYDATSVEAVKRFQTEYSGDILSPWGIGAPTGHVYFTTRKKINELYCYGEKEFPLSAFQVKQIMLYRDGTLQQPQTPVGIVPSLNPWSAIDLPILSEFNLLSPIAMPAVAPATTPSLFQNSPFESHPLLTLLRDIFSQLASGFSVERVQASH